MTDFLFSNFLGLESYELVRIELKNNEGIFIGRIVSVGGLQPYQPAFTPDNVADFHVIKDWRIYKTDMDNLNNFYSKRLHREDVEDISIVNIHNLS